MNNRSFYLLDIQGRLLKRWHGCKDQSISSDGKGCAPWQSALDDFLDQVLFPLIQSGIRPMDMLAVWDTGNTHRKMIDGNYKASRAKIERSEEAEKQVRTLFDKAKTLLAYMGIRSVHVPGEEADDLIAHLCEALPGRKVIYTGDKDLLQLVSEDVSVDRDGELHALGGFTKSPHGYAYSLTRLYLALIGDSADGYGGVKGFGPKAFARLHAALGEAAMLWLDDVLRRDEPHELDPYLEHYPDLKKVYEAWPEALRSYRLARLAPEACYGVYRGKPKRPVWHARIPNQDRVERELTEIYVFTRGAVADVALVNALNLLSRVFPRHLLVDATGPNTTMLQRYAQEILTSPIVAYDFESSDRLQHPPFREAADKNYVDVLSQELAGISINFGPNAETTIYVPFDHADTNNFSLDWARWLLSVLSQRQTPCVVQNAAFELAVSLNHLGVMPAAPYDTQIMASYVDENQGADAGSDSAVAHLKDMSQQWLNYRQATYQEVTKGRPMFQLTGDEVLSYGCDDSLVTAHLFDLFWIIMQLEGGWDFYSWHEVEPAVDDAYNFVKGTNFNLDRLAELRVDSARRLEEAAERIRSVLSDRVDNGDQGRMLRGATRLLEEWWATESIKHSSKTAEEQANAYQKLWEKAWLSTIYTPSDVEEIPLEPFVATQGSLNQVLAWISQDPSVRLTGLTRPKIAQFNEAALARLSQLSLESEEAKDLDEFIRLLGRAQSNLTPAKRKGPDYERLVSFCEEIRSVKAVRKTKVSGTPLNFGSNPQMQAMLYGILDLPVRRRSKVQRGSVRDVHKLKGSPGVGIKAVASALVFDVREDDWRRPVLEDYRTVAKEQQLESLYFSKWPLWVHPKDGRVHPQIRNCGTVTRRPSGSSPNMLQVAKGPMRSVLHPQNGKVVVSLDFANQELVILACKSRDPVMLDAFMSTPRKDIHSVTSLEYAHVLLPRLGVPVTRELSYEEYQEMLHSKDKEISFAAKTVRNKYSKAVNFLIAFVGGPTTLAENLGIDLDLAKDLMGRVFKRYARVQPWQNEVVEFARRHGYSQTAYGNRRHATKDLFSDDKGVVKRMERQLVNAEIQSSAADILKVVRQEMYRRRMRERYHLESVFPVYDEVTASVPIDAAEEYALEMREIMSITPPGFPVGMAVDLSIGLTWGTQIEVDSFDSISNVLEELKA